MSEPIRFLDADEVSRAITGRQAVRAIEGALLAGLDPAADPSRISTPLRQGEFLLMPSETPSATGIKILTLAPGNPARAQPRVQGLYVLFDADTLTPTTVLDGASVTTIRTPAVSMAAVKPALLHSEQPLHVVVFGAGPQAVGHLTCLAELLEGHRSIGSVTVAVRSPDRVTDVLPLDAIVIGANSSEAETALARAGLVICATTARDPLFDSHTLGTDVVVVAVGSHQPDVRELDSALMGRAQVIVEDRVTALRECGDVVLAVADGSLRPESLLTLADVVCARVTMQSGVPVVFKSSGMSWEDLAIAQAIAGAQ